MAPMKQLTSLLSDPSEQEFAFGAFRLQRDGTLFRGEEPIHLPPKELAALRVLLQRAGQVVSRSQLKQELWGDVHITAESVPRCLSSLRARLEPDHCIQTLYKRGYRMIGPVIRNGHQGRSGYRLAVMPFSVGQGVDPHLGPAIAEEVTAALVHAEHAQISVLARDSVFTLAGEGRTAVQVGEALHADCVLTGSLRAAPSHFRLRAEMARVSDGTQIWVEDLLVTRERVATLKDELLVRLSARLGAAVSRHITRAAEPTIRPDAYETFLRGRHEWQTLERHRMIEGMQNLVLATEMDPGLLAAKVDLAHVIVAQELCGYMPPRVAGERIRTVVRGIEDVAETATALLPSLGWIAFHVDRDVAGALEMFSQSAHLPHDAWTTRMRMMLALSLRSWEEAAEWLQAAGHNDPYAPGLQAMLAWTWHLAGKPELALSHLQEALRLFPEHECTHFYGSMILAHQGDTGRAEQMAAALVRQAPHCDHAMAIHAYTLARHHREKEGRDLLERIQWLGRERYVSTSFLAAAYLALGDTAEALAALQNANDARCPWFFQVLADPRLAALYGNAEFESLRATAEQEENAGEAVPQLRG